MTNLIGAFCSPGPRAHSPGPKPAKGGREMFSPPKKGAPRGKQVARPTWTPKPVAADAPERAAGRAIGFRVGGGVWRERERTI